MENTVQAPSQINFVSTESSFDETRRKNFFTYGFIASFVWMCFHFTLVFFFGLRLESALLVGVFLGIGNFVAFLADSPVGVLQKYILPKKLFIISAVLMLVVSLIFLYFIFGSSSPSSNSDSLLSLFLNSGINILLLFISVGLYGIIKELSDVTSLSYIMNNADPSEYADLLSRNNIFSGLGALAGLVLSGVILSFNLFVAVSILVFFIAIFIVFIVIYFDNSKMAINININDIRKLKIISPKETIESVKQYAISQVQKTDFMKVARGMKFIFLKPMQFHLKIDWKEIATTTKEDLKSFYEVLFIVPLNKRLMIMSLVVIFFGFWDTFVITFLVDFLNKIITNNDNLLLQTRLFTGYIFIALLAIPAFGAQIPLIGLSKKIGTFFVIFSGVLLSGISMFLFGVFDGFFVILLLGIGNSIGYAAAMPLAQGEFSDSYNQVYAEKRHLTEIDSNASAAPLKMILNLANVVGLIVGGILVATVGFNGTFFVLGILLMTLFGMSIVNKGKWGL
ncbi:MAG: MFS transporter [Candidatus Gracilibacteria bacterium]|nr:MFS transporter [Candidatus Gracilibacteria bacterium]